MKIFKHKVQLVNYLAGTDLYVGLLINFGTSVEVKKNKTGFTRLTGYEM